MAQVLLVADRPSAVIQPGQPPAQMAAWLLDIPEGSTAIEIAGAFASQHGFPLGTVARVIDLGATPITVATYRLDSQWVQI